MPMTSTSVAMRESHGSTERASLPALVLGGAALLLAAVFTMAALA